MLTSAQRHSDRQRAIWTEALALTRRTRDVKALVAILIAYQVKLARSIDADLNAMLDEQGIRPDPVARVDPLPLVGRTQAGTPLVEALAGIDAAQRERLAVSVLQDAGRQMSAAGITARPQVTGYVRVLEGGSCNRCVILAGKRFKWNQGFQRHPRCDCRHLPTNDDKHVTDPRSVFDAMDSTEQDLRFGKAGAEAIRMGADMGQVVNARSGITTAQVAGRAVKVTTTNARRIAGPRLMPESIIAAAESREHAIAMLRRYGYLI